MRLLNDLAGRKFGKLSPVEICGTNRHKKTLWRCVCECGNEAKVTRNNLMNGRTVSCGCVWRSNISKGTNLKHGMCGTSTYNSWSGMIKRCTDSNAPSFKNYGGRGIAVCEKWSDFRNFLADMGVAPYGMSIERIANDQGYCKENCRWATRREQSRNTRRNRLFVMGGVCKCLADWAIEHNIKYGTLQGRVDRGMSISEALKL